MTERRLRELENRAADVEDKVIKLENEIIELKYYTRDTDMTIKTLIKKLHIVSEKLEETYNKLDDYIG